MSRLGRVLGRASAALVGLVLLLALGLAVLGALDHPAVGIPSGVEGRYVEVGGVRLRYVQAGQGPDVLLIHGSPGSVEDWDPVFEPLSRRFRVTAYDRPGHGYSDPGPRRHTPDASADAAVGLMRALGLQDVLVVGHSYGGTTALNLAERYPDAVRGIVVIGARAHPGIPTAALFQLLDLPYVGRGFAVAAGALLGPTTVREGIEAAFAPNQDAIPPGFVERRIPLWRQPKVAIAAAQERTTLNGALAVMAQGYGRIRKPLFVIVGANDRNRESAERLAREVPNARLLLLPQTGHYVQFVHPDRVLELVDAALGP